MQEDFFSLADALTRELRTEEIFTCWFNGERSNFIRFNHGKVRQAGHVRQRHLDLRLIRDGRQATRSLALTGSADDFFNAKEALAQLRRVIDDLPLDPYLLFATDVKSSETKRLGKLPNSSQAVEQIIEQASGLDLVGIYAAGPMFRGFANSFGQRNWHEVENFNFEWSLYHQADKAVKSSYAGFDWKPAELKQRMELAADQLTILQQPAISIAPGEYRAFLAPRAIEEVIGMLAWGGLSAKARRTKQSPLIKMEQGAKLNDCVTLRENTAGGTAPAFQRDGFTRPAQVSLVNSGILDEALVAPRTAKEYGLVSNGANGSESPESIELAAGQLDLADALSALDTGLYINNLWYLNFSDRPACRVTGMTRFATFWVEHGKIVAPVNVMRFDDTIYRMLGENLIDLTHEQDLMLDASTYGSRSTQSAKLPGALLSGMKFTL